METQTKRNKLLKLIFLSSVKWPDAMGIWESILFTD